MKAVVTGGTGFVGSALVSELVRQGWRVECLCRRRPAVGAPAVTYHEADCRDSGALTAAFRRCGEGATLFHLAAALPTHQPTPDTETLRQVNALAPLRLFEAALAMGVPRIVHASSVTVIGTPSLRPIVESAPASPISPYAASKLEGERHAEHLRESAGLNIASLRISSCYGPGMNEASVLPTFVRAAISNQPLTWFGTGARSQNFVHVGDVVRAFLLAAESRATGVFNITGPESISMKRLAELVVRLVPGTASTAAAAGVADPAEDIRWEFDGSRARMALGYTPATGVVEGITGYADSMMRAQKA